MLTPVVISGPSATADVKPPSQAQDIADRGAAQYYPGGVGISKADGNCGVKVDWPHDSNNSSGEVHTRVHSFCNSPAYKLVSISGNAYRGHWYGWEQIGHNPPSRPKRPKNDFVVVSGKCEIGSNCKYRTEGAGVANVNGSLVGASSYQENSNAQPCT